MRLSGAAVSAVVKWCVRRNYLASVVDLTVTPEKFFRDIYIPSPMLLSEKEPLETSPCEPQLCCIAVTSRRQTGQHYCFTLSVVSSVVFMKYRVIIERNCAVIQTMLFQLLM